MYFLQKTGATSAFLALCNRENHLFTSEISQLISTGPSLGALL